MSENKKLNELLLRATKNIEFREQFLKDPVGVGKKHGVSFTKEQLEKIKRTAEFVEMLDIVRLPPGPIFYPIDPILIRWRIEEIFAVLRYLRRPPIFYPIPPWIHGGIWREKITR